MDIWFTADTHYGQANIAGPSISRWQSGYRDFESIQQMNNALVEGINESVDEDDVLYHLGDWSFGGIHNILYFRNQIKCKNIHLILGNHDKNIVNKSVKFKDDSFNPIRLFSSVRQVSEIEYKKCRFFISHYPHLTWHHSHRGTIMLHGHEHGTFNHLNENTLRMDVGVDSAKLILNEYRPFSFEEILEINLRKKVDFLPHH